MIGARSKWVMVLLALVACAVVYGLVNRMFIQADELGRTRYSDQKFIDTMESLIREKVFDVHERDIVINEDVFRQKGFSKELEQRIRAHVRHLYVKNGEIRFENKAASIANQVRHRDNLIWRGKFLDRNGVILAESSIDKNRWRTDRTYSFGPEFFPVIGHASVTYGKRYLEKDLDDYLEGRNHEPVLNTDIDPFKKVLMGDHVTLTVDSAIQRYAFQVMKDFKGAVVVVDVKSFEVLAAVSTPSFDPNEKNGEAWVSAFAGKEDRVYENRALSVAYPPGSTFKTVVATALLETGRATANERKKVICTGLKNPYGISDIHPHGAMNLDRALVESCNAYFSSKGVLLGEDLLRFAERYGFNQVVDLAPQLNQNKCFAGRSMAFAWLDRSNQLHQYMAVDFRRNPKIVAQASIGQNIVMATPLQMCLVAAAIANGGMMKNPSIIKEIKSADGKELIRAAQGGQSRKVMSFRVATQIRELMADVMKKGTGKNVKKIYREGSAYTTNPATENLNVVNIAGKTGTAEVDNKDVDNPRKPHSWFIGFAPSENPRVAIAVIAENQGFGSLTAAPIAMDVLATVLNSLR